MRDPKYNLSHKDFHHYDTIEMHMAGNKDLDEALRAAICMMAKTKCKVRFSLIGGEKEYTVYPENLEDVAESSSGFIEARPK